MNLEGLEMIAVLVVLVLFVKVLEQFGLFEPVSLEGNGCGWCCHLRGHEGQVVGPELSPRMLQGCCIHEKVLVSVGRLSGHRMQGALPVPVPGDVGREQGWQGVCCTVVTLMCAGLL